MIYYKLESNLNQKALQKMEETIPPLVEKLTYFFEDCDSIQDLLTTIDENIPFRISTSLKYPGMVPENEVWIWLSNSGSFNCKMIIDIKDAIRDFKIQDVLND